MVDWKFGTSKPGNYRGPFPGPCPNSVSTVVLWDKRGLFASLCPPWERPCLNSGTISNSGAISDSGTLLCTIALQVFVLLPRCAQWKSSTLANLWRVDKSPRIVRWTRRARRTVSWRPCRSACPEWNRRGSRSSLASPISIRIAATNRVSPPNLPDPVPTTVFSAKNNKKITLQKYVGCLIDWLRFNSFAWLIDWLTEDKFIRLIDWLIDWGSIHSLDWVDWLIEVRFIRLIDWLIADFHTVKNYSTNLP